MSASAIAEALRRYRFTYCNEDQLQEGIAAALVEEGFEVEREVRLPGLGRIDLLVGRVGIEVKVAGTPIEVASQVARYAFCEEIDGLVLVTSRPRHRIPAIANGKPVETVQLAGGAL